MVKQVSLSNDAYERLKKAKRGSESFSDVVLRIVKRPDGDLNRFFGVWRGEEYASIKSEVISGRKRSRSRELGFK